MKTILLILSFILVVSCGSRDGENDPGVTPVNTEGYFTAKIEGEQKTVRNSGNDHYVNWKKGKDDFRNKMYYKFSVYGFNQGFYFDYIIYADAIEVGKEYVYEHRSDFGNLLYDISYSEPCGAPTCSSYWGITNEFYGTPTGKITITAFDGITMSGKVEAKVNHQYYGMTENATRQITNGIFVNAVKAFGSL